MTRKQAEFLVSEIQELFGREPIVLVECLEILGFVPAVFTNLFIQEAHVSLRGEDSACLQITIGDILYPDLDNPKVDPVARTIVFEYQNDFGKKIFRAITLVEEYETEQERIRWVRLKHALI